jgi:hypothetical protein
MGGTAISITMNPCVTPIRTYPICIIVTTTDQQAEVLSEFQRRGWIRHDVAMRAFRAILFPD